MIDNIKLRARISAALEELKEVPQDAEIYVERAIEFLQGDRDNDL